MTSLDIPLLPLSLSAVPLSLQTMLSQEGIPFREHQPREPTTRFLLFDSRRRLAPRTADGQFRIDVAELSEGLPFDPLEALSDERSAPYCWKIGRYTVREEVYHTDRRRVRRTLMSRLRRRVEELGGIWLRLSAFPFPYQSAFNLRIDHDQYDAGDYDSLLSAVAGHENACSHYVCAAGFEHSSGALDRLRDHHVGSHGYHHHTYKHFDENRNNISRGIDFLAGHGIEPVGFVAPLGRHYHELPAALESLGVSHSSEFGLVYDELPMLAPKTTVLQLPVHPVCLGLFLEAAGTEEKDRENAASTAAAYFRGLVGARYQQGEPVFLYGHPTGRLGRYPELVRAIFDAADACGALWHTTLKEFEDWWRARSRARLRVYHDGVDGFRVEVDVATGTFPPAAEFWRGDHVALMPLDEPSIRFSPTSLAYQSRRPRELPRPVRLDKAHRLRAGLKRWLDWERETPIDEIDTRTLPGWIKRTLRRIKR